MVFKAVKPLSPSFPLKQKAFQQFPKVPSAGTDGSSKIIDGKSKPYEKILSYAWLSARFCQSCSNLGEFFFFTKDTQTKY